MIAVDEKASNVDLVSVWFMPPWEKSKDKNKKPVETEYRIGELRRGWLRLDALGGGYSVIFDETLLETWNGNVRKTK